MVESNATPETIQWDIMEHFGWPTLIDPAFLADYWISEFRTGYSMFSIYDGFKIDRDDLSFKVPTKYTVYGSDCGIPAMVSLGVEMMIQYGESYGIGSYKIVPDANHITMTYQGSSPHA